MTTILIIVVSLVLVALNIMAGLTLNDAMNKIHARRSGWIGEVVFLIVMLLFETAAASWMPGHLGIEIAFMEGELGGLLRSQAFLFNLGVMLCFEALGFAVGLIKAVWNKIRKKENHPAWQLLMLLLVIALCAAAGIGLTASESTAPDGPTLWPDSVTLAIMVVTGIITAAVIWRLLSPGGKGSPQAAPGKENGGAPAARPEAKGTAGSAPKPAPAAPKAEGARPAPRAPEAAETTETPTQATLDAFERAIAEKNSLIQAGRVEEAIQTLTAATSLPVDGNRKARLWNYLGLAYEKIGANDRALQCYGTALAFDPDRPSTYNNIALAHTWAGRYGEAKQYMEKTLAKMTDRAVEDPSIFYANAALIYGKSGDMARASEYLRIAAEKGAPASDLANIRKQIGLG